jgi:Mrp family chromosome partitioning ATPase
MERIQSAISKAREARRTQIESGAALASTAAPASVAGPATVEAADPFKPVVDPAEAAWAALPAFRPDARHLERSRAVAFAGGAPAVPFDSLRTRLLYLMRDKGWRRVAITSPGPGCGKTTVCLNLALGLSRLADVRTVVIDGDLRRPSLGHVLGVTGHHQIADVLAGKAEAGRHLVRVGDNLAIGTNRGPMPNSAELLQSPIAAEALDRIEDDYRPSLMILDLPPMLVSDDTMAALGLVDCVLIVAAAESTTVAELDRCEKDLATRCNVVGVVLNKCRYLEKSEGYGYGYY